MNPGPALEALAAAQQELVIMQDLIKNVETLSMISAHYVDAPRSTLQALTASAVAVEARKRDLRSASERLRQAAKQMGSETLQNNRFIECLSDLQVCVHRIAAPPEGSMRPPHPSLFKPPLLGIT